ncbi:MAG: hypothetical protein OZSIB_1799 [Candidatus Ozemobacter sibiricus]|uniref:Type II secretion system protein GspG C-terminal domain-containing protein n=1 Tax=Candidatus Ozemobacter sibiricus TaxID=2268124 RepID=A0A367ZJD8_9BACT|nr:MAG: hypothetical protein OZSIB_1799 [Candidatus Ozemobacter sibiricus]
MKNSLILMGLLWIGLATIGCTDNAKNDRARAKACSANMRVLMGAIEMYNMDYSDHPIRVLEEKMYQRGGLLLEKKLLNAPLRMPTEKCRYRSTGDLSSQKDPGIIFCNFHGSVDDLQKLFEGK